MGKAVTSHTGTRRAEDTVSIGTRHGAAEPELVPQEPQPPSKQWKLALVGLIGIYAVLAVYSLIANSSAIGMSTVASAAKTVRSASGQTASSAPSQAKTGSPHAARPSGSPLRTASSPTAHSLGVTSIAAFGPDGLSDGDNPGIASRIIDVSTNQPWYSLWYATPEFGDLQPGTGILLGMGQTVTVTSVRLVLGAALGADVQVRVGDGPYPTDLSTVASAYRVGGSVRLTATAPATGRYVLIWFTRLPSDSRGHYQVSVYSVEVDGTGGA